MNFVFLIFGMLIYLVLDIATFREAIPKTAEGKAESITIVLAQYFNLNFFYIIGGGIIGIVLVLLLQLGGVENLGFVVGFLNSVGINPDSSPGSIVLLGLLNQWIFIKLRKYFKSIAVETDSNNEIKMAKDNQK